jgi:hypothetical protein
VRRPLGLCFEFFILFFLFVGIYHVELLGVRKPNRTGYDQNDQENIGHEFADRFLKGMNRKFIFSIVDY